MSRKHSPKLSANSFRSGVRIPMHEQNSLLYTRERQKSMIKVRFLLASDKIKLILTTEFIKKYDEDLNTTLIFVSGFCSQIKSST